MWEEQAEMARPEHGQVGQAALSVSVSVFCYSLRQHTNAVTVVPANLSMNVWHAVVK